MRSGPTQQDRELQSETIEEGTLWCVTHRFTKIQADRGLVARQVSCFPLLSIYPVVKPDSILSFTESWGPGRVLCQEPDSAIFFAESLS